MDSRVYTYRYTCGLCICSLFYLVLPFAWFWVQHEKRTAAWQRSRARRVWLLVSRDRDGNPESPRCGVRNFFSRCPLSASLPSRSCRGLRLLFVLLHSRGLHLVTRLSREGKTPFPTCRVGVFRPARQPDAASVLVSCLCDFGVSSDLSSSQEQSCANSGTQRHQLPSPRLPNLLRFRLKTCASDCICANTLQ